MREKLLALLIPPFLRKLDRWLLLNHPRWWAAKFHYFIFYGLLVNLCAVLFIIFVPLPFNQLMNFNANMITISLLVEAGVFIFWLYTQSLFSIEQEYGDTHPIIRWIETILSTICVLLIFSPAMIMLATGIYKTAYDLKIRGHNICEGPIMLEFYNNSASDSGTRIDSLREALIQAEAGILSGQKIIGIEYAFFGLEEGVISSELGNEIRVVSNKILQIENGSANVLSIQPVFIKHKENISAIPKGKQATVITGDEIMTTSIHQDYVTYEGLIKIVGGAISTRAYYLTNLVKGEGVIIKEGKKMKLVTGETTIHTNSPILKFALPHFFLNYNDDFTYGIARAYETCQGVKDFSSNINIYVKNDIFELGAFILLNMIFAILGIFFTVILKDTNWRIITASFVYILALYILASVFESIFSTLLIQYLLPRSSFFYYSQFQPDFGYSAYAKGISLIGSSLVFLVVTVLSLLFASVQSMRLIKTKKYKLFPFINFVSLPVLLGYLIYILLSQIKGYQSADYFRWDETKDIILALAVFFLCYLLFAPILKKIFVYIISLPRD